MDFQDFGLAEDLANKVTIPPRPEVLVVVAAETKKEDPHIPTITESISEDVSLSSAVLQIVNSPFYGLSNKITSIQQAIGLLGVGKVEKIVTAVSMKSSLTGKLKLDRFLDSATEVANLSRTLAAHFDNIDEDDAYTLGLFHDCGMPLMMQEYTSYKDTLKIIARDDIQPFTYLEDKRYKLNHCMVGAIMCEKWFLPEHIGEAIFHHHDFYQTFEAHESRDEKFMFLLAILKMAEHLSARHRHHLREKQLIEWETVGPDILQFVGLSCDDFDHLEVELLETLKLQSEVH